MFSTCGSWLSTSNIQLGNIYLVMTSFNSIWKINIDRNLIYFQFYRRLSLKNSPIMNCYSEVFRKKERTFLIAKTHLTNRNYLAFKKYIVYMTADPANTSTGGRVVCRSFFGGRVWKGISKPKQLTSKLKKHSFYRLLSNRRKYKSGRLSTKAFLVSWREVSTGSKV